jgi:hypothetical protein
VIRVVLLPIGITTDTLAVYWRSHVIAFHGEVFSDYLVNMGAHAMHAAWLRLVQPLLGAADALWTHPWWWGNSFGLAREHLEGFLARPDALRAITVLKTPYVLAELAAGLLLLWLAWGRDDGSPRSAASVTRAKRMWVFWMLSPAALYATVLFARYEAFPVLAVVAALFLVERRRMLWAAVVLGLGITLRTYPIMLVPVFALVGYRDLPRQLGWSALALAPFLATMVINRFVGGSFGEVAAVGDYSFGSNWFAFAAQPAGGGPGWYLLPAALLALGAYLLGRQRAWWGQPVDRGELWRWVVVAHLAVFAFSQFSVHYLMWITPAVALLVLRDGWRGALPVHLAQVGGVFVAAYLLYGGVLFTGTLGGLGDSAQTLLPWSAPLMGGVARQPVNLAWTVHVVASLVLAALAVAGLWRAPSSGVDGARLVGGEEPASARRASAQTTAGRSTSSEGSPVSADP